MKVIWCLVLVGMLLCVRSSAQSLRLELQFPADIRVGEAVPVSLALRNSGDSPFYVRFTGADYGSDSLVVCAKRGDRWFRTGSIHLDRDQASLRFDFVALKPGQTLETPILGINDPVAADLPILLLPEAGTYEVFVRYESKGSVHEGVLWPIWRGVTFSGRQNLTLNVPKSETIASRRAALKACMEPDHDCARETLGYFRIVRDADAAKMLNAMLAATDVPDLALVEAVTNQRGPASREALDQFSQRFPSHAELVVRLLSSAAQETSICTETFGHISSTRMPGL